MLSYSDISMLSSEGLWADSSVSCSLRPSSLDVSLVVVPLILFQRYLPIVFVSSNKVLISSRLSPLVSGNYNSRREGSVTSQTTSLKHAYQDDDEDYVDEGWDDQDVVSPGGKRSA